MSEINTSIFSSVLTTSHLQSSYAECQSARLHMEDRYVQHVGDRFSVFGVFDGHGGTETADFVSKNLVSRLEKLENPLDPLALKQMIQQMDDELKECSECIDGSTLCFVVVGVADEKNESLPVSIVNAGDSRCLVFREEGVEAALEAAEGIEKVHPAHETVNKVSPTSLNSAPNPEIVFQTRDHKPNDPDEQKRIENAGGKVVLFRRTARLDGLIAVSRSLGDFQYKGDVSLAADEQKLISMPDITQMSLNPQTDRILLFSDGLHSKMSNEDIWRFVSRNSKNAIATAAGAARPKFNFTKSSSPSSSSACGAVICFQNTVACEPDESDLLKNLTLEPTDSKSSSKSSPFSESTTNSNSIRSALSNGSISTLVSLLEHSVQVLGSSDNHAVCLIEFLNPITPTQHYVIPAPTQNLTLGTLCPSDLTNVPFIQSFRQFALDRQFNYEAFAAQNPNHKLLKLYESIFVR